MSKNSGRKRPTKNPARNLKRKRALACACLSCEVELTFPGGYAGTGLCGPCATGESELLSERFETW